MPWRTSPALVPGRSLRLARLGSRALLAAAIAARDAVAGLAAESPRRRVPDLHAVAVFHDVRVAGFREPVRRARRGPAARSVAVDDDAHVLVAARQSLDSPEE